MSDKMPRVKITVLKRTFDADLVQEYLNAREGYGPCDVFRDGQEFFTDRLWDVPEGSCHWAWADIRRELQTITTGGEWPGYKQRGMAIACCSDAFRPVIFKIERVE